MIWMRSTAGILCMGMAMVLAAAHDSSALEEGVAKFQREDFAGAAQAGTFPLFRVPVGGREEKQVARKRRLLEVGGQRGGCLVG
jgi:hypothetical protein